MHRQMFVSWEFQLTHPWGCDERLAHKAQGLRISTHTPVRVWRLPISTTRLLLLFQLTHPWGCDIIERPESLRWQLISTHTPVRVWPSELVRAVSYKRFQLTHPWGCDVLHCHWYGWRQISTHTPVRVWLTQWGQLHRTALFQLTHPWGCDNENDEYYALTQISTHTPVRVWHVPIEAFAHFFDFNSHTREGVTVLPRNVISLWKFQLTHPWGCDRLYLTASQRL